MPLVVAMPGNKNPPLVLFDKSNIASAFGAVPVAFIATFADCEYARVFAITSNTSNNLQSILFFIGRGIFMKDIAWHIAYHTFIVYGNYIVALRNCYEK